jgi:predicted dehydrogenase
MRLKFGMVGGGNGGNIGNSHRIGAQMDSLAVLSAGCLTRNHEQNRIDCEKWGIPADRVYDDYKQMAEEESKREDCIDFVTVVTPDNTHYDIVKCFLEHGINVVCEKPFTKNIAQAEELKKIAAQNNCEVGITYTYAHYPVLRQCRRMIRDGEIGKLIDIVVEYPEQYMIESLKGDGDGMEFAKWAGDPKFAGNSNVSASLGTHLYYMITSMTGLKMTSVLSDFGYYPDGAPLETVNRFMFRLENGLKGLGWTSNVAIGHDCTMEIKIFGDDGAIEWSHGDPTRLKVTKLNGTIQYYCANKEYLCDESRNASRLPAGHPEGFHHAFANIYREFCRHITDKKNGVIKDGTEYFYPKIEDGINGVRFINACVASNKNGNTWVGLDRITDGDARIV